MIGAAKTFTYKGVAIKYYELGNGSPMVFLHGFGSSSRTWDAISKTLATKNKLFLIDLKGFGLSDKPLDKKYAISDQADIISDFIKKNNLRNLVLVGHSMGGAITLLTFLKLIKEKINPIRGLILIDNPAYKQRLPEFMKILKIPILNEMLLAILPANFRTRMSLKRCFFDDTKITDEIIKNYGDFLDSAGTYHALIETAKKIIPKNANEIVSKYPEINVPVLLIWGENDKIIPLSIGQRLAQDIPNSELAIITQCGHIPPEEKPQETAEIISDFLSKL